MSRSSSVEVSASAVRPGGRRGLQARGRAGLLPLLLLAAVFAGLFLRGLERRAQAQDLIWADPAGIELGELPAWADPRWAVELQDRMFELAPFRADDRAALAGCEAELRSLSFVRDVPRLEVDEQGRLQLALELRRPVAAIPCGESYRLVAEDGTILSGLWPVPPRIEDVWLPVLGPLEDADLFAAAVAGDWLAEPAHLAALDVALSLDGHLSLPERDLLGRVVIDASREALASVEEPGVRLLLEGRRLALFGRAPRTAGAGELSPERKWRSLARALARLRPSDAGAAVDWSLVDLRWDRPDLVVAGDVPETLRTVAGGPTVEPLPPELSSEPRPERASALSPELSSESRPERSSERSSVGDGPAESPPSAPRDRRASAGSWITPPTRAGGDGPRVH